MPVDPRPPSPLSRRLRRRWRNGDDRSLDGAHAAGGPAPEPTPTEYAVLYDGTFAAIQDVIFARHGCTADACHGSAQSGGLDLRPDAAYADLIEVTASGVALPRVNPGDFWVESADGSLIYENFVYNDPVNQYYDPPLQFDSPVAADRTLHYCAFYENGVGEDRSPDPATVKRRSTTPPNAESTCEPVACAAGCVGAACAGQDDDAARDSSPGAGDGECDACVLTGGNSTEDEMLILLGAYYVER